MPQLRSSPFIFFLLGEVLEAEYGTIILYKKVEIKTEKLHNEQLMDEVSHLRRHKLQGKFVLSIAFWE